MRVGLMGEVCVRMAFKQGVVVSQGERVPTAQWGAGRPPLGAGAAASAASEGWPPADDAGMPQGRFRGLRF